MTGEAPFDSLIRRKDDSPDLGSISSMWHVARAAAVYQKFSRAPGGETGRVAEPKLTDHKRTVPT